GRRRGMRAASASGHEQQDAREKRRRCIKRLHARSMVDTVGVKGSGSGVRASWWRSPHWRKAPIVLLRHRSALAATAAAGLVVALAASSAPLVTTASASSALKDELVDLTPFATGLQITGLARASTPSKDLDAREQTIRALGARLGLDRPVFTLETGLP